MRQFVLTLHLLFSVNFLCTAQNTTSVDVLHYKFELTLSDNSDTIKATATISIKFLISNKWIELDLGNIDNTGKGMLVSGVTIGKESISFEQHYNKLTIASGSGIKGDSTTLVIHYKGIPEDGLIIGKNLFGKRTFFGDNWPNRAHYWLPCNDIPADKASVEFIVTAPAHYGIISNGIKISENKINDTTTITHWKEDVPLPTKVMIIGAADFAVSNAAYAGNIPVTSWVYQENKTAGFHDYEKAKDILQYFINYVGPYGYKKLANVQSKTVFGGMENAGAIFYFEKSVSGYGGIDDLLAHEIAHQWFGDMITETNFKHVWLSEGFATYFTNLYIEAVNGADSMHRRMNNERNKVIAYAKQSANPIVDTTTDYFKLLNPNSYEKGAWVLHMLRMKTGDAVFKNIIREHYKKFAGYNASTEDFIAVAEKVSHQKLRSFFKQWLYQPGMPVLDVKWEYRPWSKKLIVDIEQQQTGLFSFPVELQLTSGSKKIIKTLQVSNRKTLAAFSVSEKVTGLVVDPNYKLLLQQAASN